MRAPLPPSPQRGAALLVILAFIGLGMAFLLVNALNKANRQIDRDKTTAAALAQAKEALAGFAATYGDTHSSEVAGFLACPDTDNSALTPGQADPPCGAASVSLIGRLPWNTLGLSDLRDSAGECLWYAVAGVAKDNPRLASSPGYFFNWDTLGQFVVQDAGGNILAGAPAAPHDRPLAVVLAPRAPIGAQSRAGAASRCGGNTTIANYLDGADPIYAGIAPAPGAVTTLTLATAASLAGGSNNDQGLWITSKDIFDTVKRRGDFAAFVSTDLLGSAKNALSALPAPATLNFTATPATESSGGAFVGSLEIGRVPKTALTSNALKRWQDNLLYARCTSGASCMTVNGTGCKGVVIFAGERTAAQSRASNAEKNTWSNYLEGAVLTAFTTGATTFTGAATFSATAASADVLACIAAGTGSQVSFAADLGSFVPVGSSVSVDTANQTVAVDNAGAGGGCLWYPAAIALSGKTLRARYDFTFTSGDPSGGADYGNGFTFSLLRGDAGAPISCGTKANMGAFAASDLLGFISLVMENDVYHDAANNDPTSGNHSAILYGGNLAHSAIAGGNGYTTAACDGSAQGCAYAAADKFEESSPTPLTHNQRIEIHTGYSDATCTTSGGSYARIRLWTDCSACSDTASDFSGIPSASRCLSLPAEMANIYFGFTGGFVNPQGVTIRNFELRTQ